MDVVYIVGPKGDHEDLRLSLRSIAKNLPHEKVFIIGYCPSWVTNVEKREWIQLRPKHENAWYNHRKATRDPKISADFILMNDDIFVMRPIEKVPTLNMGPIEDVLDDYAAVAKGAYWRKMKFTFDWLTERLSKPLLSYELHVPMIMNRHRLGEVLELLEASIAEPYGYHIRSVYGNMVYEETGRTIKDVKIYTKDAKLPKNTTFVSTNDHTFPGYIQHQLEKRFPNPCIYEQDV